MTFRSAATGPRSPGTGRKITVSANIYPGSREGNVRLDSDSELISFEIPTPRRAPLASSASTARSLPSMRRSPPLCTPPAFSSFTRFRPSSASDASSFNLHPRSFSILLSCSRHGSPSPSLFESHPGPRRLAADCAKCISPFAIFFYRPLANVRKINCRPVRSEMRERRTRHVGGRMKRKLGGCRFYVKSDLRVERYADDNSIKRLRCKNWYLCVSLFCFLA